MPPPRVTLMSLPADSHVHTQWSWDAPSGSMQVTCERALELGMQAIAFTEHLDHTVFTLAMEELEPGHILVQLAHQGVLTPPAFDAAGYLEEIERCRHQYPGLRILSGLEIGEPHWHTNAVAEVLAAAEFDRVLGSLHCLPDRDGLAEPPGLYRHRDPNEVMRTYLAEVAVMVSSPQRFEVLAHIDYPVRTWPRSAVPFDPLDFEEEFRHALRATAEAGRALEVSTRVPLHSHVLRWWHDEGGEAITFGSDAHEPDWIARDFRDATHLAEATGFRPRVDPAQFWTRVS